MNHTGVEIDYSPKIMNTDWKSRRFSAPQRGGSDTGDVGPSRIRLDSFSERA